MANPFWKFEFELLIPPDLAVVSLFGRFALLLEKRLPEDENSVGWLVEPNFYDMEYAEFSECV